jgi:hypothetical protein
MALSEITYGNEASIGLRYSCAAIVAIIPPWNERMGQSKNVESAPEPGSSGEGKKKALKEGKRDEMVAQRRFNSEGAIGSFK